MGMWQHGPMVRVLIAVCGLVLYVKRACVANVQTGPAGAKGSRSRPPKRPKRTKNSAAPPSGPMPLRCTNPPNVRAYVPGGGGGGCGAHVTASALHCQGPPSDAVTKLVSTPRYDI